MGLSSLFHHSTIPLLHVVGTKIEAHINQMGSGNGKHSPKSLSSAQVVQK
jgi:hypothetical protein